MRKPVIAHPKTRRAFLKRHRGFISQAARDLEIDHSHVSRVFNGLAPGEETRAYLAQRVAAIQTSESEAAGQ